MQTEQSRSIESVLHSHSNQCFVIHSKKGSTIDIVSQKEVAIRNLANRTKPIGNLLFCPTCKIRGHFSYSCKNLLHFWHGVSFLTMFEKTLSDIVKGLRAHKDNENAYISECIADCKKELGSVDKEVKVNAIEKLIYVCDSIFFSVSCLV